MFFLRLCLIAGFNELVKVTVLDFLGNSYYAQNGVGHFWAQIQQF